MNKRYIRQSLFGNISKILTVFSLVFLGHWSAMVAEEIPAGPKDGSVMGLSVENVTRTENNRLTVEMLIDLSQVNMKSNIEQVYTPYIFNGQDTARFNSFAVTGHQRLLYNQRNNLVVPVTFYKHSLVETKSNHPDISVGKVAPGPATYQMTVSTPWRDWMEYATFGVDSEVRGCANCIKNIDGISNEFLPLAQTDFVQRSFFPEFVYITPVAEAVKMREISARAYIDFPVNRIEIYPDYRRNPEELAKIRATIDSVRNDKDINITSLHISGTASPEGGYQNNVRLAKGRTEALKDYVQGLYRFPAGFIITSFEPVDWAGLAEFLKVVMTAQYVVAPSEPASASDEPQGPMFNGQRYPAAGPVVSNTSAMDSIRYDQFQNIPGTPAEWREILPNAGNILAIVDSDIEPVNRNNKIKTSYPAEYAWLLENVYPALRHSDYRIQFEIKTFTEVSEILEVMASQPQKLSLAELFVAANSQEPGSDIFNQAFDLAVTMFPEDETANLNAATAAMQRGDLMNAERYLSKVTEVAPESDYARAMLTLLKGDEDAALDQFRSLAGSLNPTVAAKAAAAVQGLEEVRTANSRTFTRPE